jgi:hypothetical protein
MKKLKKHQQFHLVGLDANVFRRSLKGDANQSPIDRRAERTGRPWQAVKDVEG